ncbi:FHF complex subunit HOOK-interacting protein 2B-like isoform X2 [Eleginops maclovinus]|uniref:FHF complex subunit HOOK-interacting protein 2B-like isoform X2 n=1 Tax=Eleginops maclovinus TaxID=56733 RepID=UPI003080FB49
MEAFSKLGSMLLHALETREPTVDLLESFVDHWKAITNYYIETTDDSRPVKQTEIPWRLKQMLDILVYEEKQQVTHTHLDTHTPDGCVCVQAMQAPRACLEYLLQHKLLETLVTLGKAQYPPGMVQQVLLFFSKLLSQIQKPLLQLVNVYRPVQLIRLCALPGSQTEKEEAQFLLVICSRVKQDPDTLRYVLEIVHQSAARTTASVQSQNDPASNHATEPPISSKSVASPCSLVQSEASPCSLVQSEASPCSPVQSETSPCSPVQSEASPCSPVQSEASPCSLVQSEASPGSPVQSEASPCSPVQSETSPCSPVQSESGLLSALLQLTSSQRGSVCVKAYESLLLLAALEGSAGELLSLSTRLGELLVGRLLLLHALLPLEDLLPEELQSWPHTPWSSESPTSGHMPNFFAWLNFLDHLMTEAPQVLALKLSQCVRRFWLVDVLQPQLLHTCEQVVLVSTSLLSAVVRLVQSSSLLDQIVHFLLRTDPLTHLLLQRCDHISDQISMASLSLVEELLQKPHRDILEVLVLSFLQSRSYLSSPAGGAEDRLPESIEANEDSDDLEEDPFFFSDSQLLSPALSSPPSASAPSGLGSSADVVNSFLCLVPVQVRSAQMLQEGGYESYVHDAHTLVTDCGSLSLSWDWPLRPPPPSGEEQFFEGPLLRVLFNRLGRVLEQPYELSLQVTAVLSRLSAFSHPLLQEYLLNPYIHLSHCCRSLFSVLIRLMGELMQRIQQVSILTDRLLDTRRHLLGLTPNTGLEHLTLLKGIIVLEEFCKELAAIAFVKLPLESSDSPGDLPGPAVTPLGLY